MLTRFLIERRNAIVRRYLPAVNPVVDLQLSPSGTLTFRNAAVDADVASAPAEYAVVWSRFDNATGATTALGTTKASTPRVDAPRDLPTGEGTLRPPGHLRDGRPAGLDDAGACGLPP